jgi:UDP-N-acetylglucosamine 2-epimerase (non-hydrolysing)
MGLKGHAYGLVTLHRPSNVDDPHSLRLLCETLLRISKLIKLVFPIHPRTRKNLVTHNILNYLENSDIYMVQPLSYVRFMNLLFNCRFAITDSGGIQEETTYLGIPCFTLRANTERPITVTEGTNQLCTASDVESKVIDLLRNGQQVKGAIALWDGHTANRVVDHIRSKSS